MKKDKKTTVKADKTIDKSNMPVKNTATDKIKNTALQTPGLNQSKTTRDDLLPSDGDNFTS